MVEHDHVDPLGAQPGDFRERGGAAVDRQEQVRAVPGQAPLQPFLAQPIPFVPAMWQE